MQSTEQIRQINIEDELRFSYLDYAMSVIIGRALPDVRDGLKPVHRRILYAMFREGLLSNKKFSKCAGVVGEVLKKYHPHGDSAVYDALVRMAQEWNMRYPVVDGQGNFGSIDGDAAAAYRYTESRLTKLAEEFLADIDKETVPFVENFDNSTHEPDVLPTRVPNLLINGSSGIAVGMATNIPPHNLSEIIDAAIHLIEKPDATARDLLRLVPGPDFPTAGVIHGRDGILKAYETGRGTITIRGIAQVEDGKRGEQIVISEIPYQVNKARLVEQIADLVKDGRLTGISDIRDESDREGLRVVVDLKKDAHGEIILNQLFSLTKLEVSFGIIMLAIVNKRPRVLPLTEILRLFIKHRKEVVTKRTEFDLKKAEARAHILEGLKIAVENIDEIVALIKAAENPQEAQKKLQGRFSLSTAQAQAILEMRLQRLTGLERDKIGQEYDQVLQQIAELKKILADEKLIYGIIVDELKVIKQTYGDERRTRIEGATKELSAEDLIADEEMVITISHKGYIKRLPTNTYRAQRRGGRGVLGMGTRDTDFVVELFNASTHATLLTFSNMGKVFSVKVHELPLASRTAKGSPIVNFIPLDKDERISAVLPIHDFSFAGHVMMATQLGYIKKTPLSEFEHVRRSGIIALSLEDGDRLVAARLTKGEQDVFIGTKAGLAIRFHETDVRPMGRAARGVRAISLADDDSVVGMEILYWESTLLTVTANGYGKRTPTNEYRRQSRGGKGIITIKTTGRNGPVVSIRQVIDKDNLIIVTDKGQIIRMNVKDLPTMGRNTQGVRLINLQDDERTVAISRVMDQDGHETD